MSKGTDSVLQILIGAWIAISFIIAAILALLLKWVIVYGWTFRISLEVIQK